MFVENTGVAGAAFLAFGWIPQPAAPALVERIYRLDSVNLVPIGEYGCFFYVAPSCADIAESETMVCIKLGQIHDGQALLSASAILERGLISPADACAEAISGNGVLLCFDKQEPRYCAYKTVFSTPQLYYWTGEGVVLCADNQRLIADLIENPEVNPAALVPHFLFRTVSGHEDYVRDVYRLGHGEVMTWHDGTINISLRRTLRSLFDGIEYHDVDRNSAEWLYERLMTVMRFCLAGMGDAQRESANLLSGGIDSSLLQLTLNDLIPAPSRCRTFSYALDTPGFAPEIRYAQDASRVFDTAHTFIDITSADYPDLLVRTIEILGSPPHHESVPCVLGVAEYVANNVPEVVYLFCGGSTEGLEMSADLVRAQKYRGWPAFLLRLLGVVLEPIAHSKAYGARMAAEIAPYFDDIESPRNPVNTTGVYTNGALVRRAFGASAVQEALARRRALEERLLDSPNLIEKVQWTTMLYGADDTAGYWRQLGQACGREILFPYMDEIMVGALLACDPQIRFFYKNRTKPLYKLILESRGADEITQDKPKFGSGYGDDLFVMMKQGALRDMTQAIERPAFLSQADFAQVLAQPDWFTWNLLTLDIFNKRVLARASAN